jgi:Ca-activated chloride channel family protein
MNSANKLGLLKKSLRLLVNQLTPQDRVAIVVYAGASGVVLESTPGNRRSEIITAMERLRAGGSTNGGAGIELAYAIAQQHFKKDGINRVILATDGDFNVGPSNTGALKALIKEKKRSGVGLTILGFGMGNYNDQMLEAISNAGDGNAAYIDTLQEAQKVLVEEIGSTLNTIARDTKIQIEFNPEIVNSYRLVGYENRLLNKEDFKNDRIDAGDVGAGHTVTALYEIVLNQPLRYTPVQTRALQFNNEFAFLKLRYKRPDEESSIEMQHAIASDDHHQQLDHTSDNFRFAAAVAGFGQRLRSSDSLGDYSYPEISQLAQQSRGNDAFGYRAEFIQLVNLADSLQ